MKLPTYNTLGKTRSRTVSARLEFQPAYPRKKISAYTNFKLKSEVILVERINDKHLMAVKQKRTYNKEPLISITASPNRP